MIKISNLDFTVSSESVSSQNNNCCEKNSARLILATDQEYRSFVSEQLMLRKDYEGFLAQLEINCVALLSVFEVNFEPVHWILRSLYCETKRGKQPCDPQILLRSFLLMLAFKETSITNWSKRLQTEPLLALFCGTTIKKAPALGTYYEFLKRLENGPYQPKCQHRILPSEQRLATERKEPLRKKPKEKPAVEQKEKDVLKKCAQQTIDKENQPIVKDLEKILNEILLLVAVCPSHEKDIIKDLQQLTLAGDGSTIASCANTYGKTTCDCRSKGIYDCEHDRFFSDIDAKWGWDNSKKDYIYGYRYWQLVCADNKHDLPIYINIAPANTHEAHMAIRAIDRFDKQQATLMQSQVKIKELALDALFDVYAMYDYLNHKQILYAIPYSTAPAKCITLGEDGRLFTDKGQPICPGGLPMLRITLDKQGRQVYQCPVKRMARRDGKIIRVFHEHECPLGSLCEPDSQTGPLVHVAKNIDTRIHPPLRRESQRYKELAQMRTCCERSNSAKKYGYKLASARMRVMPYAYCRLAFASVLEHSKVWATQKMEKFDFKSRSIIELFQ